MKKILDIVMKYTDAEGRILSQPFMKLPTRKELPDYYEVIKKPIDINKILKRLQDDKYTVSTINQTKNITFNLTESMILYLVRAGIGRFG